MVLGSRLGQTVRDTQDSSKTIDSTGKGSSTIMMGTYMMESGRMTKPMAKASILKTMGQFMKEIGSRICSMDLESL